MNKDGLTRKPFPKMTRADLILHVKYLEALVKFDLDAIDQHCKEKELLQLYVPAMLKRKIQREVWGE